MNLFSPPTDSFYKFVAVAGLMIFVTCGFLLYKDDHSKNELLVKQQGEERLLQNEVSILIDELKYNKKYKKFTDSIESTIGKLLGKKVDMKNINDSLYKDSLTKVMVYNMPDSIQIKYKSCLLKKEELAVKRDFIKDNVSDFDKIMWWVYLISLYIGELAALLGILLWYDRIQKPLDEAQDKKIIQRLLQGKEWAEKCQSCFKTFLFIGERGSEKDENISKLFCKECYSIGSFSEPTLTFEEASSRLTIRLTDLKYKKRTIKKNLKKFHDALRWKRKILW